jgi:hypothetical protein
VFLFKAVIFASIAFCVPISYANADSYPDGITSLSAVPKLQKSMQAYEPKCCQKLLDNLELVKVKYFGYDDKVHTGVLIVHKELAKDIQEIFQILLKAQFPIEKIHPIGSEQKNMSFAVPNYTIAYNCRKVTGQKMLSQHSYGRAIDINPLVNPYVKEGESIPKEGKPFIDRSKAHKGMINKNSLIVTLFAERGWDWGGNWFDVQDYQHFEKRANGEKRNPYGYNINQVIM